MTDDELVIEIALTRLDHPGLELEETVALVVRRMDRDRVLELAGRNLVERDGLRGGAFESAVECLLRLVLRLRDQD